MSQSINFALFVLSFAITFAIGAAYAADSSPETKRTCRVILDICELSCKDRGKIYKFQCIGENYPPQGSQYRCICGDEIGANEK